MTAALIAEALAHAESVTPKQLGEHFRVSIEDEAGDCSDYVDSLRGDIEQRLDGEGRYPFVRWDCMVAALAHLAERDERAEARATKLRAALDAVHYELTTDIGEEQRDPQAIFRAKRRVALTVAQDDTKEADRG